VWHGVGRATAKLQPAFSDLRKPGLAEATKLTTVKEIQMKPPKAGWRACVCVLAAVLSWLVVLLTPVFAAAPSLQPDPQAQISDVYAFVGTKFNDSTVNVLNIIVNIRPFSNPSDGLNFDRFSDDVRYNLQIANPNTGALIRSYHFRFSPVSSAAGTYKNLGTIFSYGRGSALGAIQHTNDPSQNFTQEYSVKKFVASTNVTTQIAGGLLVPPPNVGLRTTPHYNDASGIPVSGATSNAGLDIYTQETIHALPSGEVVWAGPRDDSFFFDLGGFSDLLDPRILGPDGHGQTGNGIDTRAGKNVLTIAMQIPIASLPSIQYTDAFTGISHGVGVYASADRQQQVVRSGLTDPVATGSWVQVARAGNPMFSDFMVAITDKDNYERDIPTHDAKKYAPYAKTSELAFLFNTVYGTSFVTTGRSDLAAMFIPDVLRVDTTTGPVPQIGQGGNRLSGLGGDTTGGKWSGWPNGRRLGDDVVDILFTAIASGPAYSSIFLLGDNVNHNDETFNFVFPYAATPHSGARECNDGCSP
jgi:hypothetical protein